METTTYRVTGMTCGGCVKTLTRALEQALPNVEAEVRLEGGVVRIRGEHTAAAVTQAVQDAGYDMAPG